MLILTIIAPHGSGRLTPDLLARIEAQAQAPVRILAPAEAAELHVATPPDLSWLTTLDAVVTPDTNRRKRLLIADMDSTIVTGETLDELAVYAGVGDQVAAITRRSMNGELDFAAALRERVALLKDLPVEALQRTWANVRLTPGAQALVHTMRAHGAQTALVSGGFTWFTERVAALCGFQHHRANTLLHTGAALTGTVGEPILDRSAKLATLNELAAAYRLTLDDCLALGDGANDLDMIQAAGLGVAYHAKPIVAQAASARIDHADLRALLYIQGYTQAEIVE